MRIRVKTPIVDMHGRSLKPGMIVTWHDAKEARRLCKAGYAEPETEYLLRCLKPYSVSSITLTSDAPKGLIRQLRAVAKRVGVKVQVTKVKPEPEPEE